MSDPTDMTQGATDGGKCEVTLAQINAVRQNNKCFCKLFNLINLTQSNISTKFCCCFM